MDYYIPIVLCAVLYISYHLVLERACRQVLDVDSKSVLISGCDTGEYMYVCTGLVKNQNDFHT